MSDTKLIVAVRWIDPHRPNQVWAYPDSLDHEPYECFGVGIVCKWDDVGMTICMHTGSGLYGNTFFLPTGAIKEVSVLEYSDKCQQVTRDPVQPKDGRHAGPPLSGPKKRKGPRRRVGVGP